MNINCNSYPHFYSSKQGLGLHLGHYLSHIWCYLLNEEVTSANSAAEGNSARRMPRAQQ